MIPFFSPQNQRKEQIIGRAVVTAVAILFLLVAALRSLPSEDALSDHFNQFSLSGYSQAESKPAQAPRELEDFHDRPLTEYVEAYGPSIQT